MSMDHGKLANLCLFVGCKMGSLSLPNQCLCTCWSNCSFVRFVARKCFGKEANFFRIFKRALFKEGCFIFCCSWFVNL
jgi:hypothetical protein